VKGAHRAMPGDQADSRRGGLMVRALRGAEFLGGPRCAGRVGHPLGPAGP